MPRLDEKGQWIDDGESLKERAESRRALEQATAEAVLHLMEIIPVGDQGHSLRRHLSQSLLRYRKCRGMETTDGS